MSLPNPDFVRQAAAAVRARAPAIPSVGVVLGSGLGAFAEDLESSVQIPYAEIPYLPSPKVAGHAGTLHLGRIGQVSVACLQGRVHAYEGHPLEDVVFGVSLLAELGCKSVLLSNAAGGIADGMQAGDLMLITDHLNLSGLTPLLGPARDGIPRFLDMTAAYSPALQRSARRAANGLQVSLHEGVYAGLLGPSYETPAEIRMLRTLGASAVGMSTVLEVLALRALGVEVGAISCITNLAAGLAGHVLTHEDVKETAARVETTFRALFRRWILEAFAA